MRPLIGITSEIEELEYRTSLYIDVRYGRMVEEAGGVPLILHPMDLIKEGLARIDGLILSGGGDVHPRYYNEEQNFPMTISPDMRTDFEMALLREAMNRKVPVLGICHGMQLINVALGGTLYQDLPSQKGVQHRLKEKRHPVLIAEGTRLHAITGKREAEVTSSHHQAVKVLAGGLRASAFSGDGIMEAFEMDDNPFLFGVQWHPEKDPDETSYALFRGFIALTR